MLKTEDTCNEWIFTFGQNHILRGHYLRIHGSYEEARERMIESFGTRWAFQYSADEWDERRKDPKRTWIMEKELIL